ncbi:hypothetical protein EDM56_03435 [Brevibacillus fluminis]|uniref:Uncharacterized protein n=1 Tax=Brevibacillus fluminis TaxID=511487 RepID=A0A3M8DXV0_9BACL|nr:hypothetical protein [Brevibacillus fluminis]RNB91817.1 hypothetical protein EDM56_03435 [Brevibacillus fluminis]
MNGMQLVEFLRTTEDKIMHIHRAIDHISSNDELKESVAVLTEVIKDYQIQTEKVKGKLQSIEVGDQHQQQQQQYR